MKVITQKAAITLFLIFLGALFTLPAYAEILDYNDYNLNLRFEPINGGVQIYRGLYAQGTQSDEIIRGTDLKSKVSALIQRVKDSLSMLKFRRSDQIRGAELSRIASNNANDILRSSKLAQQLQKTQQKDKMAELRARNRDLNLRIRDLSRR
ncbi:MAG: hypothetical protein JW847_09490 [Candidatus Omnitrophica bacterium]|nr:hypothetical protein [Candidatus Omnitrophota bacterium]